MKNSNSKTYISIFNSVFPEPPDLIYDLKGSIVARKTKDPIKLKDPKAVKLDLDLNGRKFDVGSAVKQRLMDQIKLDCELLERHNLMDYSLLVGVKNISKESKTVSKKNVKKSSKQKGKEKLLKRKRNKHDITYGFISQDGTEKYYIGIIDYLCKYTNTKAFAHITKTIFIDHTGKKMSTVNPKFYSIRFQRFLDSVFT